jgi:hypothetical protein
MEVFVMTEEDLKPISKKRAIVLAIGEYAKKVGKKHYFWFLVGVICGWLFL